MKNEKADMFKMCELTDEDIRRIVTDIFGPKRITGIRRHKREDYISCNIYTEWSSTDENGEVETTTCRDEIELRNPFEYGDDAIRSGDFPLRWQDYTMLKQFCFAHGIIPGWVRNNPYAESSEERMKR